MNSLYNLSLHVSPSLALEIQSVVFIIYLFIYLFFTKRRLTVFCKHPQTFYYFQQLMGREKTCYLLTKTELCLQAVSAVKSTYYKGVNTLECVNLVDDKDYDQQ